MARVLKRYFLATLFALLGGSAAAWAAQVGMVMSEESSAFAEAGEAITAELRSAGHRVQIFPFPLRPEDSNAIASSALLVTLGSRAAQAVSALASHPMVIHTLLPRSAFDKLPVRPDEARRSSAVFIDQPPARQIELVRLALPEWSHIALITGRDSAELGGRLQSTAREHRLRPVVEYVNTEGELYPTLQRVLAEPAVLLAVPDATLFNSSTISNILLTAYHHRSPVVGFSAAYVKAGALLALYSTPAQIGQHAGEMARYGLATGSLPAAQYPRYFRVGTNPYVARSLGIPLEDANVLREKLERAEVAQ